MLSASYNNATQVLTVNGSAADDDIQIVEDPTTHLVSVIENGFTSMTINHNLVRRIDVYAGLGDDRVDAAGLNIRMYGYGGAGNDWLIAGLAPVTFEGGDGNDYLIGSDGGDVLHGNAGNDNLSAGWGNDVMYGDDGDDRMVGGENADIFWGGAGTDTADYFTRSANLTISLQGWADDGEAGEGDNVNSDVENVIGGSGNDTISSPLWMATANSFRGGDGNDYLDGGAGDDRLDGGFGDDDLWAFSGNDSLIGGFGDDFLHGEAGDDVMDGGADDDFFFGGAGADTADYSSRYLALVITFDGIANDGTSTTEHDNVADDMEIVVGGLGNDRITARPSSADPKTFYGGNGNDSLTGGLGNDALFGGAGDDLLQSSAGDDQLVGGAGNDHMFGSYGNDNLDGGDGNDNMNGEVGDDVLEGGAGNDQILGGVGNDNLSGGDGDDNLNAQAGNDFLRGGAGTDILDGSTDTDTGVPDGVDTLRNIEMFA